MAGNEIVIAEYLVLNLNKLSLPRFGIIKSIGVPSAESGEYVEVDNVRAIKRLLATEDSRKKADIYINGQGVSLKQQGASFSYNRLQRANLIEIFKLLKFDNPSSILSRLDKEVRNFHNGDIEGRNRPWQDFFTDSEFKALTKFLMVQGSPNVGFSAHPATYILEAPSRSISEACIGIFTFEEYFNKYKNSLKIAIRRQWYGQASNSEHGRAKSLMQKPENMPWIFNNVAGMPNVHRSNKRWRDDVPANERKTVYFLMIEKEA